MKKIQSILLLGSGALKIGEAGEFDYSGTQAIKALKEEGKRVILVNPNVATIQTSAGLADEVYFLPVTPEYVEKVIVKEKPDGVLLSFGGQTALNCGLALNTQGVFRKYGVQILGTPISAIEATEDRKIFAQRLKDIGLETAKGKTVSTVKSGVAFGKSLGFPVMVRAGFALGGTGSGIAKTKDELHVLLTNALAVTPQVIVEECLSGWKELEYEVVRDCNNNCITVCNMENFDPVGIHTGESIVVAPSQTLTNHEYFMLRQAAIDAICEFKIVGECNIQYALNPKTNEFRVIEVNARLSRSSALASKATGYPLAYIAAKLALGVTLPELQNKVTGKTTAFFEPALDYVVVKIPRWDLDKFTHVSQVIGSEMKSVGEVMSIGRTFEEAIQKASRMMVGGQRGVMDLVIQGTPKALETQLKDPDPYRLFTVCAALRVGVSTKRIHQITGIDHWFLSKLENVVNVYHNLVSLKKAISPELLRKAKELGYSDNQIGIIVGKSEEAIRTRRKSLGIIPYIKQIDTTSGEFPAQTNYMFLTYNASKHDYVPGKSEEKAIVLGCGPYAIGTSVEFDWCAVNTVTTLKSEGWKSVIINCNPETVSTDYDISDFLYFEELSLERVMDIYEHEQAPLIVSVGGQIPNNLVPRLSENKVPMLGTRAKNILMAEDRKLFSNLMDSIGIRQPEWGEVTTVHDADMFANKVGYPILVRPSFVLSGKAMSVIESKELLYEYSKQINFNRKNLSLVMTKFLAGATECDVDGVAKNGKILLTAISEHVESGGVHSGDSTLLQPPQTISESDQKTILKKTKKIIKSLHITGPFNVQFLISDGEFYVIECNARASRSIPFVSKTIGINFIELATKIVIGKSGSVKTQRAFPYVSVKVPQFSFHKLRGSDPILTVEMNSTGEVVGFGKDRYEAYLKGIMATGVGYPTKKAVFLSLGGARRKLQFLQSAKKLHQAGFTLYVTTGTGLFMREHEIPAITIGKIHEGTHPNILDLLQGKMIDYAIVLSEHGNETKRGKLAKSKSDGYMMRRMAVDMGIAIFTQHQSAELFVESTLRYSPETVEIAAWGKYIKR